MPSLSELIAQKEAIELQIKEIHENERKEAIKSARNLIEEFALTPDELFGKSKSRLVVAKYINPQTGETWTGRGRTPKWLAGKNPDDFLIEK
jgi:DNA-binding protein H-NS